MTTKKTADPATQKVSDLTVEEFRGLIREVVLECIGESYEDFHRDLELNPEFAAELQASIDEVAAGAPTIPYEQMSEIESATLAEES